MEILFFSNTTITFFTHHRYTNLPICPDSQLETKWSYSYS